MKASPSVTTPEFTMCEFYWAYATFYDLGWT